MRFIKLHERHGTKFDDFYNPVRILNADIISIILESEDSYGCAVCLKECDEDTGKYYHYDVIESIDEIFEMLNKEY